MGLKYRRIYIGLTTGILTLAAIFTLLSFYGLKIECDEYKVCDKLYCTVYCNVTNPTYRSIYLYNKEDWTLNFTPEVQDYKLYVKYYGKWHYTNFTNKTRLGNIPKDRKYVFVFPRYSTKQFMLKVKLKDAEKIKYTFGTLDPYLIGWKYMYEEIPVEVPVYEEKTVYVPEVKYSNGTIPGRYATKKYLSHYKIEFRKGKKIGVNIGGTKYYGHYNVKKNFLYKWSVPIGDRNLKEFGECREYEIQKGVCQKIDVLSELK